MAGIEMVGGGSEASIGMAGSFVKLARTTNLASSEANSVLVQNTMYIN